MTEYEVIRIVAESITIIGGVGAVFWILLKNLYKSHRLQEENTRETHSLKDEMVKLNGLVREHSVLDDKRFGEIQASLETAALTDAKEHAAGGERLARIEGRMGLPPVEEKK